MILSRSFEDAVGTQLVAQYADLIEGGSEALRPALRKFLLQSARFETGPVLERLAQSPALATEAAFLKGKVPSSRPLLHRKWRTPGKLYLRPQGTNIFLSP